MNNIVNKIIILAGATASGKTALAAELIKKYPFEIVSADSRQVYRGLDIGTGKDKGVAQHMIDVIGPQKNQKSEIRNMEGNSLYSVAKFRDMALKIIEEIWGRGKIPLIVGGTGFYIDALIYEQNTNLTPPNAKIREKLSKLNNEQLLDIINKVDPSTFSRIDQQNRTRLIRAAEIVLKTGKPIAPVIKQFRPEWDISLFVLDIQREELYKHIDKRVDARIEEGMIEEVVGLIESGVSAEWLLSLGLEYYWITRWLIQNSKFKIQSYGSSHYRSVISNSVRDPVGVEEDEILRRAQDDNLTKEEMILRLKFAIHAYARRQNTYFKRWPNAKWGSAEYIQDKISTTCLN